MFIFRNDVKQFSQVVRLCLNMARTKATAVAARGRGRGRGRGRVVESVEDAKREFQNPKTNHKAKVEIEGLGVKSRKRKTKKNQTRSKVPLHQDSCP